MFFCSKYPIYLLNQAYKHVFTSPSSVEKEPKATRSGNARIHGMTRVTLASIAYIATQVCIKHFTAILKANASPRSGLRYARPLFSREPIQPRILKGSTTVLSSFLTILKRRKRLMICWYGGIGEFPLHWSLPLLNRQNTHSQIFPNYSSAKRPVSKNSALAKIKERRAALKALNLNVVQQT